MNSMKYLFIGFLLLPFSDVFSQISVDTKAFSNLNGTEIKVAGKNLMPSASDIAGCGSVKSYEPLFQP